MKIVQKQKAKTGWTPEKRQAVLDAVDFAKKFYELDEGTLQISYAGFEWYGDCIPIDEDTISIRISGRHTFEDTIKAVFHEMTHVKQYMRKELLPMEVRIHKGLSIKVHATWKGQKYMTSMDTATSKKVPWEAEAYTMEKLLYGVYK